MIEEALVSILNGNAGWTALVASRLYPGKLPQNATYPAATYRQVGERGESTLDTSPSQLVAARYRFFCVDHSYLKTKQVTAALVAALSGYRGTVSGVEILGIFPEYAVDDWDDNTQTHQSVRDFTVHALK